MKFTFVLIIISDKINLFCISLHQDGVQAVEIISHKKEGPKSHLT